jgi:hypothetical protein
VAGRRSGAKPRPSLSLSLPPTLSLPTIPLEPGPLLLLTFLCVLSAIGIVFHSRIPAHAPLFASRRFCKRTAESPPAAAAAASGAPLAPDAAARSSPRQQVGEPIFDFAQLKAQDAQGLDLRQGLVCHHTAEHLQRRESLSGPIV